MNLSAPFIERPVATTLLTIGLALAGTAAFPLLPVSPLPQVDFPTISVQASLPGASPETMAATVATPLERSLGRIAGITEMTSSSSLGSTRHHAAIRSEPRHRRRGARRAGRAQRRAEPAADGIAQQSDLPQGQPCRRADHDPGADVGHADAGADVRRGLDDHRAEAVAIAGRRPGAVGGSSLPAVRVELNPQALNKYGIGFEDVRAVLAATNANRPKGAVEEGDRHWQIYANDQAKTAAEYLPLIVAYRNGSAVKLTDLGDVVDSVQDLRNAGSSNGKPSVLIIIFRQPNANIIETVDSVTAMLPLLRASIPSAIKLDVVVERTTTIRASLRDVERTLVLAVMPGRPGRVPVPARLAGDADSERGRAGVADRHVRRHVSVRLQPQQSVADGGDHRHRFRRR